MSSSSAAVFQWADQLRFLFEQLKSREPCVDTDWVATRITETLILLRGELGAGCVSSVEVDFEVYLSLKGKLDEAFTKSRTVRRRSEEVLDSLSTGLSDDLRARLVTLDDADSEALAAARAIQNEAARRWSNVIEMLDAYGEYAGELRVVLSRLPVGRFSQPFSEIIAELDNLADRLRQLLRYVAVAAPEWELQTPDHLVAEVWTVRVSPLASLRAMANMFWSAVRHPLSNTTIDLSTGRVLYRT